SSLRPTSTAPTSSLSLHAALPIFAFITAAALWRRRRLGGVARIDFSMLEAMLWTMAEPLLAEQLGATRLPAGNRSECHAPHSAYRCAGDDQWISIAVTDDEQWRRLCAVIPALAPVARLGFAQRMEQERAID